MPSTSFDTVDKSKSKGTEDSNKTESKTSIKKKRLTKVTLTQNIMIKNRQNSSSFHRYSDLGSKQKVTESANFTPFTPVRLSRTPANFEEGRRTMFTLKSPKADYAQLKKSAVFGGGSSELAAVETETV